MIMLGIFRPTYLGGSSGVVIGCLFNLVEFLSQAVPGVRESSLSYHYWIRHYFSIRASTQYAILQENNGIYQCVHPYPVCNSKLSANQRLAVVLTEM